MADATFRTNRNHLKIAAVTMALGAVAVLSAAALAQDGSSGASENAVKNGQPQSVSANWVVVGPGSMWSPVPEPEPSVDLPRNVILMIGDGMGPVQMDAGSMYAFGKAGNLYMQTLPHQGFVTTHSADDETTDSAAAATAMATGVKVNNDVIALAIPGSGEPLQTMLEIFQAQGRSTGLVTTTEITHATPAAFGAHTVSRDEQELIGEHLFTVTRPNVLLGGGGDIDFDIGLNAGYALVQNREELQAIDTDSATLLHGYFAEGNMRYETNDMQDMPHLSEMTATALDVLDNDPDGLFLMVEGGRIDHAGHNHLIEELCGEVVEFDNTVRTVIEWAAGRDDTLVIITADHETGGLSIRRPRDAGSAPRVNWSTGYHTDVNVPVFAWGVGAELVEGVIDNTDIFTIATGIDPAE